LVLGLGLGLELGLGLGLGLGLCSPYSPQVEQPPEVLPCPKQQQQQPEASDAEAVKAATAAAYNQVGET
jgi:hypothetical protein